MTYLAKCDTCSATEPLQPGDRSPVGWRFWLERTETTRGREVSGRHACPKCGREEK